MRVIKQNVYLFLGYDRTDREEDAWGYNILLVHTEI